MIKIYLCEDNLEQLQKVKQIVESVIMIEDLDMQLTLATNDPYKLLNEIKNEQSVGLYFLDVDLKADMNGIKLGEEIRKYDPRGFIVYITSHAEMSYLTFVYKVEALDYIVKDNFTDLHTRVHKCILNAYEKYSSLSKDDQQKYFHVKSGDKNVYLEYDKILFLETSQTVHKIKVHAEDRQIEFYGRIKDVMEKLDNRFYKCHRSFIVNKNKIKEIDKKNRIIHLVNGQQCLASVRLLKGLS